jgi:hypothetical protein
MGEKVQIEANCDQPQQHEEQQICHAAANYCQVLKEFQSSKESKRNKGIYFIPFIN